MSINNETLRSAIDLISNPDDVSDTMQEASIPFPTQHSVHVLRHGLELHRAETALRTQLEELVNRGRRNPQFRAEAILNLTREGEDVGAVFKSTNKLGGLWRVVSAGILSSHTFATREIALLHWLELSVNGQADNATYYAARVLGLGDDDQ